MTHVPEGTTRSRINHPNIIRKKHPRNPADYGDASITAKKARISIDITPRPKAQPKPRSLIIRFASLPKQAKPIATQTEPLPPPPPKPINHHQKVINGIKHELARLQPNSANLKAEKRKLRSQEDTRFKSKLSTYFPEYNEVIGNEPKEYRKTLFQISTLL
jgi:hypothetical protein